MNIKILFRTASLLSAIMICLSACLKKDLPEYPLFDGNEITLVSAEHRFNTGRMMNGQPVVGYQKLTTASQIDKANGVINVSITVPGASGDFTAAEKTKVTQSNLWFYCNISTAATIKAINGTPSLGDPTNATKPLQFEVTAANGEKRTWTINITSFTN
ncbi:hypothetical protein WJU16_05455 [Chitinophaga pollutisoli]|uniref:DUF5018 domain-containing protein n=1 Tax=Chitinophaga pollutisoli TaxID=3133966 RepID=A0ABZ2YSY0_9BACT